MSQVTSFNCPTCGAPLSVSGNETEVKCSFCGNVAVVPESLRAKQPAVPPTVVVKMPTGAYQQAMLQQAREMQRSAYRTSSTVGIVFTIVIFVAVIGSVVFFANVRNGGSSSSSSNLLSAISGAGSGFATLNMTIGDKGTGLGLFDDVRGVAVDGDGNIYTAEYTSGRIQKFDPTGKFVKTWTPDGKTPLLSMAADTGGNLWIARGGLLHYSADGKLLGQLISFEDVFIENVAIRPDGDLEVFQPTNGDDLIRLTAQGTEISRIHNAISAQTDSPELDARMAVDGLGNIFAMGSFNNAVFKFTKDGKYVNKFGEEGDQPGQFRAMNAIAIDGQGRVYVADIKGIQIFTGDGRYLDVIKVPNYVAFGLAFDSKNNLYVASRDHVYKYTINNTAKDSSS